MSSPSATQSAGANGVGSPPSDAQIEEELCLLDLEDADSLLEHVQDLISLNFDDFPDDQVDDEASRYAAKMAKASITDGTRTGHLRIIRHYFTFQLRRNKKWDPKLVNEQTPRDIATFITQKCGPIEDGFEGKKIAYLLAWLMLLRIDEVIKLKFENIDKIPGERKFINAQ
ncbi:hypothetical protein C8R46DRAFT_1046516 [Mycena filopes]|nr:hypothetical protein C8R46DRAFT_1046516 [Mycena filopes]